MLPFSNSNIYKNQKGFSLGNFTSPIFDEVNDPKDLQSTYQLLPVVPFFGTNTSSSDAFLSVLYRLSEITPVFAGAIEVVKNFGIGAGWQLSKMEGLGIINKNVKDASNAEIKTFEQEFVNTLHRTSLHEISEYGIKSLTIDGNAGFLVSVEKLSGKAKIEHVKTTKWKYHTDILKDSNDKVVVISNTFLYSVLKDTPPKFVPIYPDFAENEEGLIQTFVHVKTVLPSRDIYGLSSVASSIMHQYALNQLMIYLSSAIENRFTGQVFFDSVLDASDLEGDISDNVKRFIQDQKNTLTNSGDEKGSVINRFRSNGVEKTHVTQFKANTEHDFYDSIMKILSDAILLSIGIDKRLMGDNSESGMFGEKLDAIYMGASQSVRPTQQILEGGINDCLSFIEEQTGKNIRSGNVLKLKSFYREMIKDRIKGEQEAENENETTTTENE